MAKQGNQFTNKDYYARFQNQIPLYSASTTYNLGDLVRTMEGTEWKALVNSPSAAPSETNTSQWEEFEFERFGYRRFVTLDTIIKNFMVAYTGDNSVLGKSSKLMVEFFAQQAAQEFSYDIFRVREMEYELVRGLVMPMPQDLASVAKISFTDQYGNERPLYPRRRSGNPESPIQDSSGNIEFGSDGDIRYSGRLTDKNATNQSITQDRFNENQGEFGSAIQFQGVPGDNVFSDNGSYYSDGARYYIDPELSNVNGTYTIDENAGTISFDSSLEGQIVSLKYVSTFQDDDPRKIYIPKLAEKAILQTVYIEILEKRDPPARIGTLQLAEKKRKALTRNAKIRLQNYNNAELTQMFRGQTKYIKT